MTAETMECMSFPASPLQWNEMLNQGAKIFSLRVGGNVTCVGSSSLGKDTCHLYVIYSAKAILCLTGNIPYYRDSTQNDVNSLPKQITHTLFYFLSPLQFIMKCCTGDRRCLHSSFLTKAEFPQPPAAVCSWGLTWMAWAVCHEANLLPESWEAALSAISETEG